MDLQHISQIGYATCGQMLNAEGFKVFELGGFFEKLPISRLETDILQLPKGLEIKPNGEIFGVVRFYSKDKKYYFMFFVHYKYAGNEQITGGRPCFYAGAVGYVLENSNQPYNNPNIVELLGFLDLVTENAKHKILMPSKEIAKVTLPKFFNTQKQAYKYALSDAKMKGYFYLPNIEEQKFSFVELAYGKSFETYQQIFGISSQEIISDIKDRSILDLSLALPQAQDSITTEKEIGFVENIAQAEPTKTENNKEILTDLQKENSILKRENESLKQEVARLSELNTEQNEIILEIRKQQSEKSEMAKNTIDLRFSLAIVAFVIIFLFIVYRITEPQTSKSEIPQNTEQLLDSINVLNRNISNQMSEKNKVVANLERKINSQNEEITTLKKNLESRDIVTVPQLQSIHHVVKSGENLTLIAKKYSVSIKELIERNPSDIKKADSSVKDGVKLFIKKE
jgi:LysM repeat protein